MFYLLWRLSLDVLYAGLELRLGADCWLLYSDLWPPEFPVRLRFGCLGLILFVFVNCWTAAEKTQRLCERRLNMMISCLNVEINAFEHFTRDGHVTKTSSSCVCLFIQFYVHRNSTCLNLFKPVCTDGNFYFRSRWCWIMFRTSELMFPCGVNWYRKVKYGCVSDKVCVK